MNRCPRPLKPPIRKKYQDTHLYNILEVDILSWYLLVLPKALKALIFMPGKIQGTHLNNTFFIEIIKCMLLYNYGQIWEFRYLTKITIMDSGANV